MQKKKILAAAMAAAMAVAMAVPMGAEMAATGKTKNGNEKKICFQPNRRRKQKKYWFYYSTAF